MVERSTSVSVCGIRTVEFYKLTRMPSVCMYMHVGYNNNYHRGQEQRRQGEGWGVMCTQSIHPLHVSFYCLPSLSRHYPTVCTFITLPQTVNVCQYLYTGLLTWNSTQYTVNTISSSEMLYYCKHLQSLCIHLCCTVAFVCLHPAKELSRGATALGKIRMMAQLIAPLDATRCGDRFKTRESSPKSHAWSNQIP